MVNSKNPVASPAGRTLLVNAIITRISTYTIGIDVSMTARISTGSQASTKYGAARMDKKLYMTVVLISDGECYEGSVWEGAMFAGHHELNKLVAIIDRNRLCTLDFTENCLRLDPMDDKWKAFGWEVVSIDGHSFEEIFGVFDNFRSRKSTKPLMIIANTTKGKGVSFMENNPMAHTLIPSGEQLQKAKEELRK